jgi:Sulfotransferase family
MMSFQDFEGTRVTDGETIFSLADGTIVRPDYPFFITGSGRCGTTLMRRLVVERTHAIVPPENYVLATSARLMTQAGGDWPRFCRQCLSHLRASPDWAVRLDPDPAEILGLLTSIPPIFRTVADFWHALHAVLATRVGKPAETRWGDKTPSNAGLLPEIRRLFPDARVLLLVRDVFDMAWSYGTTAIPGRTGRYLEGARRWVAANTRALCFAARHPDQVLIVRYEDLTTGPEREMARVLTHLALPVFPPGVLNDLEARDIVSHKHLGNTLGAVTGDSIGKGRAGLPVAVREMIADLAAPLQTRLGYEATGRAEAASRAV